MARRVALRIVASGALTVAVVAAIAWLAAREREEGASGATRDGGSAPPPPGDAITPADAVGAMPEAAAPGLEARAEPPLTEPAAAEPPYAFFGLLIDRASGAPLPDVEVRERTMVVDPARKTVAIGNSRATSDRDGVFELKIPRDERPMFEVVSLDFGQTLFQVEPGHETRATALAIEIDSGAALDVLVVDGVGAPYGEAQVDLAFRSHELGTPLRARRSGPLQTRSAATSSFGTTDFVRLPANAPIRARATAKGTGDDAEATVVLAPGERREITLAIGGSAAIAGRLVDERGDAVPGYEIWLAREILAGEPVEGAALFVDVDRVSCHAAVETDSDGRFRIESVASGTWWIGPAAFRDAALGDGTAAPVASAIAVAPGAREVEVELTAVAARWIRGFVVDPDGERAYATVTAKPSELLGLAGASTDEAGAFLLGPLAPGEHELVARWTGAPSEPVRTLAGAGDVVLRLRVGAGISGRVADAHTGERVAAEVVLSARDGSRPRIEASVAGEFGWYDLGPGAYDVAARTLDGRVGALRGISLREGDLAENLDLLVLPGARLRISYDGSARRARYTIVSGEAVVASDSIDDGTWVRECVPPGALAVAIDFGGEPADVRAVSVDAGFEADVDFRMP
jgi:hypothetical protein